MKRKPSKRPEKRPNGGMIHARHEMRAGPLPDAEELYRYDTILPGAAERIISMAEKQQAFSHKRAMRSLNLQALGMASGFLLGAAGLGAAYYMINLGMAGTHQVIWAIAVVISVALGGRLYLSSKDKK